MRAPQFAHVSIRSPGSSGSTSARDRSRRATGPIVDEPERGPGRGGGQAIRGVHDRHPTPLRTPSDAPSAIAAAIGQRALHGLLARPRAPSRDRRPQLGSAVSASRSGSRSWPERREVEPGLGDQAAARRRPTCVRRRRCGRRSAGAASTTADQHEREARTGRGRPELAQASARGRPRRRAGRGHAPRPNARVNRAQLTQNGSPMPLEDLDRPGRGVLGAGEVAAIARSPRRGPTAPCPCPPRRRAASRSPAPRRAAAGPRPRIELDPLRPESRSAGARRTGCRAAFAISRLVAQARAPRRSAAA